MNKKMLLALALVALALFAYIGLVEQHSLSTGELSGREARLLPRLVRARVEGITLDHGETHLVIQRVRAEAGELGEWRLVEPVEARADQEAVASLLGSLEWADARRRLGAVSAEDLRSFGLEEPRAHVELTVADERTSLSIGGPAATGDGVYAQIGEGEAAVVGQDLLEALTADVGHFRDKSLFTGIDLDGLSSLRIERAAEGDASASELSFEQREGRFWIAGERRLMAANSRVREAARFMAELSAARFVDAEPADAGLDDPRLVVRMQLTAEEGEAPATHLLEAGGACADHPAERYARADGGPVVCVLASDLTGFERPGEAYRQARLVTIASEDLEGADVRVAGQSLTLSHTTEGYHFEAEGQGEGEASRAVVSQWLASIGHIAPLELLVVPEAEMAGYGLSGDGDGVTLRAQGDAPAERVRLGSVMPDGQWVRRGDEEAVLRISGEDAAKLALRALDLRSRQLVEEREASVAEISLTRDGVEERLARRDGRWRVLAPSELPADGARVSSLASKLARLSALRFVSARPRPEQGLSNASVRIHARYEGALPSEEGADEDHAQDAEAAPREHTLKLGARIEEGVFAQLDDDPSVFLLPVEWLDATHQPYASRDLLRSTATQVRALTLTTPASEVSLHYDGMAWATPDGPANAERTDALLEAVHALRASAMQGYLPAAAPMTDPEVRLEVTRVDDAEEPRHYVVDIAAAEPGQADRRARREDLPVEMRVPAAAAQTLLDYQP